MKKTYSINEIVKWYDKYTDTPISDEFIIFIINKGIVKPIDIGEYSLDEINKFLLDSYEDNFIYDENGKYKVKDNRKEIIKKYPKKEMKKPKKFKITSLNGNKLKLIKLN